MLSANCNGFGLGSSFKIEQATKERKSREVDGNCISSSDARWGSANKTIMENELKIINNQIALSASCRKETLDNNASFSKGGIMTAMWRDVSNCMKLDECA